MPTIDQAPSEPTLTLGELVEVDPRRILVEASRDLMLGLFHSHAVHMVDALAGHIIAEPLGAAGKRMVVGGPIQGRTRLPDVADRHQFRQ